MTPQQINTILFWTTLGIVALSVGLMYGADKYGQRLAREAKAKKSAKSAKKVKTTRKKEI